MSHENMNNSARPYSPFSPFRLSNREVTPTKAAANELLRRTTSAYPAPLSKQDAEMVAAFRLARELFQKNLAAGLAVVDESDTREMV